MNWINLVLDLDAPEGDKAKKLWDWSSSLKKNKQRRYQNYQDCLTAYLGRRDTNDIGPRSAETVTIGYNTIRATTDTLVSPLANNKVLPYFLTEKGDAELQAKAKNMQEFVEGEFYDAGLYGANSWELAKRGLIFEGTGVKVSPDYANARLTFDLVWAHQVYVPSIEAKQNNVRSMAHIYTADRSVLLATFKDADKETLEAIKKAAPAKLDEELNSDNTNEISDQIEIVEAWHLPSGRVDLNNKESFKFGNKLHDGIHIIAVEGKILLKEAWPFDHFQIEFFLPNKIPGKFWSQSIPSLLAATQAQINKWDNRKFSIMDNYAVPKLIVSKESNIQPSQISNAIGDILVVQGSPHNAVMPLVTPSVPTDIFDEIGRLTANSEKLVGLNEMSISATKPAGVNHAPGMQMLADHESIRQMHIFKAWENFYLGLAKLTVEMIRLLAQHNPKGYKKIFGNDKELKAYDWKKVDLGRDKYKLKAWPTNLLPRTPAAKLSRVIDLLQGQLITPDQALRLLDFPDIESVLGDSTAEIDNVEHYIRLALEGGDGETIIPSPYMALELLMSRAKSTYNRMEADGANDTILSRLRNLMELTDAQIKAMAPPPPPAPPAPQQNANAPAPGVMPPAAA